MLGIFMAIAEIAARFHVTVDARKQELKRKQDAINKGKEFYTDRYGTQHYVKNDQPFFIRSDFDYNAMRMGDKWEVDPYTSKKIRNISAEARRKTEQEEKKKAIVAGQRYYAFEGVSHNHINDKIVGVRYKNIDNENIYVIRKYNNCKLLINIKTGLADDWVRENSYKMGCTTKMLPVINSTTDKREWMKVEINDDVMKSVINDYNAKVEKWIKDYDDPWFGQSRSRDSILIL